MHMQKNRLVLTAVLVALLVLVAIVSIATVAVTEPQKVFGTTLVLGGIAIATFAFMAAYSVAITVAVWAGRSITALIDYALRNPQRLARMLWIIPANITTALKMITIPILTIARHCYSFAREIDVGRAISGIFLWSAQWLKARADLIRLALDTQHLFLGTGQLQLRR